MQNANIYNYKKSSGTFLFFLSFRPASAFHFCFCSVNYPFIIISLFIYAGMYFPWEAAAWFLWVGATWLHPCFFWHRGAALSNQGVGSLARLALGAGCTLAVYLMHHSIWQCMLILTEPALGWVVRPETHIGEKKEGHEQLEGKEGEGTPASQAPSLCLPLLPLCFWGNQAGSKGTTCFKGLLPGTSLLFV